MAISPYIAELRRKIGHDMLLVPAVCAIIPEANGRVLLHRATEDGRWHMIGGSVEPGEEPADAIVREVREETGLEVLPIRVTGIYKGQPLTYRNGDKLEYIAIAFLCRVTGGELKIGDDESLELGYFAPDALPELSPNHVARIRDAMSGQSGAWFKPAGLSSR